MSALARMPPAPEPRPPAPAMLSYKANGQICWMNSVAREAFGEVTSVMSLLTSSQPQPPFTCLPLGREWLWLGTCPTDPWEATVRCIERLLAEMYFRCGAQHLKLLRAHGLFLESAYGTAERRLFRQYVADFYARLEEERKRIARDLHDTASQSLTGIKLNLELVGRHLDSANAEALDRLKRSQELVAVALEQIRTVSHGLRPPDWDKCEFAEAVESLVDGMALRSRFRVDLGRIDTPKNLSRQKKTALYEILKAGLVNVVQHSGASCVYIEAPVISGWAYLIIEDNGRGFDPAAPLRSGGIGLKNMRERIELVDGKLEIRTAPGTGVRLCASVPAGERARAAGAD